MRNQKRFLLQSPYLEIAILAISTVVAFVGLGIISSVEQPLAAGQMSTGTIALILLAFFLLSVAIAAVSVIAGIGGGVIFTPIMLAFTNINSLVVRGTGLIVAMFSGLSSSGVFIKKGIGNFKLCVIMALSQGLGALAGAIAAVSVSSSLGDMGEGIMRSILGCILAAVAVYFFIGGNKLVYPEVTSQDRLTRWLAFDSVYFEESEGKARAYRVQRAALGIGLLFLVGLIGGFFGMGGGWAITPVLNMAMSVPLKVAAANSGVILGMGSCISIWPYIFAGGVIPLFVLPWLAGQITGGFIGSYLLAKIRVQVVRLILIGIMGYTSFGLVAKGLAIAGVIQPVSPLIQVAVLIAVIAGVVTAIVLQHIRQKRDTVHEG